MRILGIDYGDKRIGLALSDPLGIIASPLTVLERKGDADFDYLSRIIKENEIKKAVIGLPKNMDGTEGASAEKARAFADQISQKCAIEIIFRDERLTSVSANRLLDEADMHWSKRNKVVDKIAAQIILQSYLDGGGR